MKIHTLATFAALSMMVGAPVIAQAATAKAKPAKHATTAKVAKPAKMAAPKAAPKAK